MRIKARKKTGNANAGEPFENHVAILMLYEVPHRAAQKEQRPYEHDFDPALEDQVTA